jgi:uncharacterized protein
MENTNYANRIAQELGLTIKQVAATLALLQEGATVPFIARYRKEVTQSLDEVAIASIRDRAEQLSELDKRREAILKSLESQEKLTPELEKAVTEAETLAVLEDIYLPYKPKRRTKAQMAREKDLEPLAKSLYDQEVKDPQAEALKFVSEEKGVNSVEEALEGARHIIAEWINENSEVRQKLRKLFADKAVITSKVISGKEEEGEKFQNYFDWSEAVKDIPSHRMLALRRGEKELILSLTIAPETDDALNIIKRIVINTQKGNSHQIEESITDAYKRLLKPSLETELRLNSKQAADEAAVAVFAKNLRELLLASPLGTKRVLALDPGFRTGCKVVCLNQQGKLLEHTAIYPNPPQRKIGESANVLHALCEKHKIEAVAIGNGTASRETEQFVKSISLPGNPMIVMVNESGASIYSASEVAREEFPNEDVTVRGSVSIGRRLMDPLAELVKIDPKSIGVGQYQHDVDQGLLKKSLDDTVMSCVNTVGVEVNTASKELLGYVSGLGNQIAQNIINFRNENGPFSSREELRKVPRLGPKAYEQAAGFLRIQGAKNPLDESAVHPERYELIKVMAKDAGCSVAELIKFSENRKKIKLQQYVSEEVGLPTLHDIMQELEKPGRDPREKFEVFNFAEDVHEISDLKIGMKLPGIVTNVTKFGAFVDIGVHQDGLVHISQLSNKFISDPNEVVSVQQKVEVTVTEVDIDRKRIALSMIESQGSNARNEKRGNKNSKQAESKPEDMLAMLKNKFNQR